MLASGGVNCQIKAWWWQDGAALCLVVRYGAKVIELAKGKRAVQVEREDQVKACIHIHIELALCRGADTDRQVLAQREVDRLKDGPNADDIVAAKARVAAA